MSQADDDFDDFVCTPEFDRHMTETHEFNKYMMEKEVERLQLLLSASRKDSVYADGLRKRLDRILGKRVATDLYQCDSCGQEVPSDQIKTGMTFGVEGRFCGRCRGEREDTEPPEFRWCESCHALWHGDVWQHHDSKPLELWPGQPLPLKVKTCGESVNEPPYPHLPVIVVDTGKVR